jgi:hypothetical protein
MNHYFATDLICKMGILHMPYTLYLTQKIEHDAQTPQGLVSLLTLFIG